MGVAAARPHPNMAVLSKPFKAQGSKENFCKILTATLQETAMYKFGAIHSP